MKTIPYLLLQWTWGIIQNSFGLLTLTLLGRKKPYFFHGALVTEWHLKGSMGLGMFIFLEKNLDESYRENVLRHEYGHTIQSILLGPFFLLVIGLPSLLWAGFFQKYRERKHVSYYAFYTERWANHEARKALELEIHP